MQVREQTAQRTGRAAIRESLQNATVISDLDVKQERQAETETKQERVINGSKKLADANAKGEAMVTELRTLTQGVVKRIEEIGLTVAQSGEFRGFKEKALATIGKIVPEAMNRAQQLRVARLDVATVEEAVKEIESFVQETIHKLGEVEAEFAQNVVSYSAKIDTVLSKLKEATPRQIEAERRKAELEAQLSVIDMEMKSGTISQADRPAKEREKEALTRDLEKARLEAVEYTTIVIEAQRAMPTLQQNKTAATDSIESIHGMRRNLLEEWQNLGVILENAMTAVRARAQLERYQTVKPALGRSVTVITDHNIAVQGAALEIAAQQLTKAAVDPTTSREFFNRQTQHVNDFLVGWAQLQEEARQGVRGE